MKKEIEFDADGNIIDPKDATHIIVIKGDHTTVPLTEIVLAEVLQVVECGVEFAPGWNYEGGEVATRDPENYCREIGADWSRCEYKGHYLRGNGALLVGDGVKYTNVDYFHCGTAIVLMAKELEGYDEAAEDYTREI